MTWQIANSQFTPASRQPYILLSKRPTLFLSVPASSGSSTNTFLRAGLQKCARRRQSTSKLEAQSMQPAVPTRWGARLLPRKSTHFAELQILELIHMRAANFDPTHSSSFIPSTLSITVIASKNAVFGTAGVFGGFLSLRPSLSELWSCENFLQNIRSRSPSFVIHSVIMPRSANHNFHRHDRVHYCVCQSPSLHP